MNAVPSGGRRLHLFGHIKFERDGLPVALSLPPKGLALLALIVAHHDRPIAREWLAQRLWPDDDLAAGRANLRRHVHLVTKLIGEDAFSVTRQTVQWQSGCAVTADVVEFDRLAATNPPDALPLYAGDLAASLSDEAIFDERTAYAQRYAAAIRDVCERSRASGDDEALMTALQYAVAHDRLDEAAARELMSVRYRLGDRAGALRDFTTLQSRLRAELDVEPEAATVALYESILTANGRIETPSNLPAPAGSFVGRDRQMHALAFQIRKQRLVTIAGAGGMGKTRLAIELSRSQLRHFSGGAWFVDLRQARDERDIYERIAIACGVKELNAPKDALAERLSGERTLIVLDNCEHLLVEIRKAAGFLLDRTAAHVLATSRRRLGVENEVCENLEPLALPALDAAPEELLRTPSVLLFLERAARVMPDVRVQFENARGFAEIVRRLDGLPLALELVASRANLLTIDGIAKRLRDGLPSFKKIHSVTAWSYDLLSENERHVFETCAVFDGSFSLEALEAVLADSHGDGFEELSELVESSLVQTHPHRSGYRYSLLETTREFAAAKLEARGDSMRVRSAHAHYWAARLEQIYPFSEGAREAEYFFAIDEVYADIRSALEFALESQPALAIAIVSSLYRYWALRGRLREGWSAVQSCELGNTLASRSLQQQARFAQAAGVLARELGESERARTYFARALELYRASGDRTRRAETIWAHAKLEFNCGDARLARDLYQSCLELYRELGDEAGIASTIANIGSATHALGDLEGARSLYREALAEYERIGYVRGLAFIHRQLALVEQNLGDLDAALASARRSIALCAEIGDTLREGDVLNILSSALIECGRYEESLAAALRALEILERSNHAQFTMLAVEALAQAAQFCGHHAHAVRFHACAEALRRRRGLALWSGYQADVDSQIAQLREALSEEAFHAAWALGETMTPAAVLALARTLTKTRSADMRA